MKIDKSRQTIRFWTSVVALCAWLISCGWDEGPYKIGFSGGLTGRYSDLGTAGRNGVILAFEEVNGAGGVGGRRIELITKDDRQDPGVAARVDRELIEEGVQAIIGHMTSTMSMAVLPLINEKRIVMISPTSSTGELKGKDDYFIRVIGTSIEKPRRLAEFAIRVADSVSILYDLENREYSESYVRHFTQRFSELGGKAGLLLPFSREDKDAFDVLAARLTESGCKGILLVASAMDAAAVCQQLRKISKDFRVFSSGWAMTQDFIQNAGRAAEGVIFAEFFSAESRAEDYLAFKRRYVDRFGAEPNFAAAYGYDAAMVLIAALRKDPDPSRLKKTILEIRRFKGPQGPFEIDSFGDAVRPPALARVSQGRFVPVE
jgi:branched-chain amino acid transport system substrate-binding protein